MPPITSTDFAHVGSSPVFFLTFLLASQLLSLSQPDRLLRVLAVAVAFLYSINLLLTFFGPVGVHGLLQRLTVGMAAAWVFVNALHVRSEAPA